MTPDEFAELEMHVAAGTDLPTALAALPQDEQPPASRGCILALVLAFVFIAVWLLR